MGIPSLNIAITESLEKKRKAKRMGAVMNEKNQNFVNSKSDFNTLTSFKGNVNNTAKA